jgi:CheY-like chemotaxis protein
MATPFSDGNGFGGSDVTPACLRDKDSDLSPAGQPEIYPPKATDVLSAEILESRGHEVIEACDGQDALDKLEQTSPDLVLLDIQMPVLDGYAVLRRIRGNARFAALRVLAVTAFAMQGNREQVLAAGFDGYLSKPIDISLLSKEPREFLE